MLMSHLIKIIYPWGKTTSDVIWGSCVIHNVENALNICLYYSIMLIPFVPFMISKAAYMKQIKNINLLSSTLMTVY